MNWYSDFLELFLTEEPIDNLTLETNTYTIFPLCVCWEGGGVCVYVFFVLLLLQIGLLRQ